MYVRSPSTNDLTRVFVGLFLCGFAFTAEAAHTLSLVDGQKLSSTSLAIDGQGNVVCDNGKSIDLMDVRSIRNDGVTAAKTGTKIVIDLLGGGRLRVTELTYADEQSIAKWSGAANSDEPIKLPVDAMTAIRFDDTKRAEFEKAIAEPSRDFDQVFVVVDKQIQMIRGLLESVDDQNVTLQWEGREQTLPRAKVFGIVIARIGKEPDRAGHCLVHFRDDSTLWVEQIKIGNDKLSASLPFGVKVEAPSNTVAQIRVNTPRLTFLSDLTPTNIDQETIVTFPRPWRRDQSVGGRTLKLSGTTFEKGIGMQSRTAITYQVNAAYQTLSATIGIDDETGGKGDCEFVVRGDGKELFRKQKKGEDQPEEIRIDVSGMEQIMLIVEPGADLDLADHADWCDARLIKAN